MRHRSLAALVAALLVLAPAAALAEGDGPGEQRTSDGYTVTLSADGPAQTGQNRITVSIRDPQGVPVTSASVELRLLGHTAEEQGHSHGESAQPEAEHAEEGTAPHMATPDTGHDADGAHPHDGDTMPHMATPDTGHDADEQGHSHAEGSAMPGINMPEDEQSEGGAMPGMNMPEDGHAEDNHAEGNHAKNAIASVPMQPSGQGYQAQVEFAEAGTWAVAVAFRDSLGQERVVELSLEVAQQRPRGLVLGGFLAVNLLAIGGAAALRTISPPKPRGNGRRTPAAQEKPA
ncbi:hypothetical protein F8S13_02375 [Chloroflexia bacterium SDU3-3]|nr:hypothetical protein F8S13_02375 [Chloroflexia bacterium SDU3-3]